MDQNNFYVSHTGEQLGPFTIQQIQEKLESNALHVTDYVYVESKEDWILISEFLKEHTDNKPKSEPQPPLSGIKVNLDEIYSSPVESQLESQLETTDTSEAIELDADDLSASTDLEEFSSNGNSMEIETIVLDEEPAPMKSDEPVTPPETVSASAQAPPSNKNIKSNLKSSHCRIEKGQAAWNWKSEQQGSFAVTISIESDDGKLRTVNQEINVAAGPATTLRWQCNNDGSVDDHNLITFSVYDDFGNPCLAHQTQLSLTDQQGEQKTAEIKNGKCEFKWTSEVSGSRTLHVEDTQGVLKIESQPETQFHHGKFSSIAVSTSENPRVGEEVEFSITAVDQYGNKVEDFNGEVMIKIDDKETRLPLKDGQASNVKAG